MLGGRIPRVNRTRRGFVFLALVSAFLLPIPGRAAQPAPSYRNDWAASLKFFGLTAHTFATRWDYPLAIDRRGFLVGQIGGEADLDYYVNNHLLFRLANSVYKDCFNLWAGASHLGFRANLPVGSLFETRIGIGPTIIWRENWWREVDDFGGDPFYGFDEQKGRIQSAFLWWGGNLDLEYLISDRTAVVLTVVPALVVYTFSLGARYHFSGR